MSQNLRVRTGLMLACGAVLVALAPSSASAGNHGFKVLHAFTGGLDGANPASPVIVGSDGNFYSTTYAGGASGNGVIFRLTPRGKLKTLWSFSGSDGTSPNGLVEDAAGNFHGTNYAGGDSGQGTVFTYSHDGTLTTDCSFNGSNGGYPYVGLTADGAGNFYGTTTAGGSYGRGVVFKNDCQVVHSFRGQPTDGEMPNAGNLVMDAAGNLYGETIAGGINNWGSVFKIAPDGTESIIYSFCSAMNCADGGAPGGSLVMDEVGNLYSTTYTGGMYDVGTVFKLKPNGKLTVLHDFTDDENGGLSDAGLILDGTNLYGTALGGVGGCWNNWGCGLVFTLHTNGSGFKVLHSFTGGDDGGSPLADLYLKDDGYLYGTAYMGNGDNPNGTVFRVKK